MSQKLILASNSPRRKELLDKTGFPYKIVVSEINEKLNENFTPEENVKSLAEQKAEAVSLNYPDAVIIGADTMVCVDNVSLGKPKNEQEAKQMLKRLSGRIHTVMTGVCIKSNDITLSFVEKTDVAFYDLTDEEINNYISTGDSFDKAGAYGIQGQGALFVKRINGDFFSVMGLPVARVYRELKSILN
ncbi:septum formation inhibitor Maf [Terrilactibacillus sp. BCM23-1]|uniref:dTTP/UTP pyrophosphatase n=1 Tax=Terrilactibacillus tamarindi TaxID=2599694 RepID=A0A6N8CMN7_9BACI|nr:Maf family protein [Terrilactibacillus tamarindi]MTT31329.1 septum formation inhibitor Maf [Terrilactibacillus tamarindi]